MFLSFIEKPVEGLIHDLETPVEEVKRVFGVVITAVKDIIKELIALAHHLDEAFNSTTFQNIFVKPFEKGTTMVLQGLKDIVRVILQTGKEAFTYFYPDIKGAIDDAYSVAKQGIADLKDAYHKAFDVVERGAERVMDDSLETVHCLIDNIGEGIGLIKDDLGRIFTVISADAVELDHEFVGFAQSGATHFTASVNRVGNIAIQNTEALEQNIANRFSNENSALDFIFVGMIMAFLVGFFSIILTTKSFDLLMTIIVIAVMVFISYLFF